MKIICVDDEALVLQLVVRLCEQLPQVSEVKGFTNPLEALEYLKSHPADIALLDIEMPKMNGIHLAIKVKEMHPDISVIFLTGYSHYALEAFKVHANGYLLKPLEKDKLEAEIAYLLKEKEPAKYPRYYAKTFGVFDFLIDGKSVNFSRSKAKELLAFLIDSQGAGIKRAEAFAALYEDKAYDRKMQKQFNVIVHNLKTTLEENGAGEILNIKSGELSVNAELLDCDLYRLLNGDVNAVNAYRGKYMSTYQWANMTEAFLDRTVSK